MTIDVNFLRLRAERGDGLCPNEHTIHRNDDTTEMWITCGTEELGRLALPRTSQDRSDEIRYFLSVTTAAHDRRVAGDVVLGLLGDRGMGTEKGEQ